MARLRGTVALIPLLAFGGVAGWIYWQATAKDRVIAEKQRVIAELGKKLDRTWSSELMADVRVNALVTDPRTGQRVMDLTFIQYQPGTETAALQKDLLLPGEELYIDALVIQFERKFIEEGDALRGKSLLLFRRAFGDKQKPAEGTPLFRTGSGDPPIPERIQVDAQPSEFERQLWTDFWKLANDPTKAREAGVRIAQGEAPHVKAAQGQVYKLTLRASGGLEMVPRIPAAALGR